MQELSCLTADNESYVKSVTETKRCVRCGEQKPPGAFGKNGALKDGLCAYCKACRSAVGKVQYAADPEKQKARNRKWRADNPERVRELAEKNRPNHRRQMREAYAKRMSDPTKRAEYIEYMRAYRAANRARVNEIGAEYYTRAKTKNPEMLAAKGRRRHERERAAGPVTLVEKRAIWDAYDGRCYICHRDAEQYDHVQPLAAGGTNEPDNIRPICAGCNARKGCVWPIDFDELRARVYREYRQQEETEEADQEPAATLSGATF